LADNNADEHKRSSHDGRVNPQGGLHLAVFSLPVARAMTTAIPTDATADSGSDRAGPYFLGINCAHDAAACIVGEAGILVAIREERLTRRKHDLGFPRQAIGYCLDALGLGSLEAISGATINQLPGLDCQFDLRAMGYRGSLDINPSHHLLHACYAQYFVGSRDGLIVVADGSGYHYAEYRRTGSPMLGREEPDGDAYEAQTVFELRDGALSLVHKHWGVWKGMMPYYRFPSLGHAYATAAQHIFREVMGWIYAGKVMGLAPFGKLSDQIPSVMSYGDDGFMFDLEWARRLPALDGRTEYWTDPVCQDIAARVQHDLETALLAWLRKLARDHGARSLCLTGGVAHNSVANGKVLSAASFAEHHFTPAADDAGTAIGGALFAFQQALQRQPKGDYRNDFHGRAYAAEELERAVQHDTRIVLTRFDDAAAFARDAAQRLADGAIVALHDGGSEFSARSLGHRSILCDARSPSAKDDLNSRVKFREPFRPYAVMVLAHEVGRYFRAPESSPYMMAVADVHPEKRALIPAACHVDGTCRVQTIDEAYQGRARAILQAFHERTGMPMLLNTSFNIRGEPIIETPEEAVECLCSSGLDALYMYPYRIEKHRPSWNANDPEMRRLVPMLGRSFRLTSTRASEDGGWGVDRHHLRSRTGYEIELSAQEFGFVQKLDRRVSVGELLDGAPEPGTAMSMLEKFNKGGLVSFARQE
jgi:carbamoyltransferase